MRVNAIAAGATLTDALGPFVEDESLMTAMKERTPLARLGDANEIAARVLFLASPAGAWIMGKLFEVDGATTASNWPWPIAQRPLINATKWTREAIATRTSRCHQ